VLAVGHRAGERVQLDLMRAWRGSRLRPVDFAEIEAAILDAHKRYRFTLHLDPWQGLDLAQRLRARGLRVEEYAFTTASKQRLAATLLSLVNGGQLALYEADGLREELQGLRLVQNPAGGWGFDHKTGGHDDMAVALSLMAVAAVGESRVGAGWMQYLRGELAKRESDAGQLEAARAQAVAAGQLPGVRFVEFERTPAAKTCPRSVDRRHRFQHKADGSIVCMACGGWRDPAAA
jgi:hypothetical protein